MTTPEILATVTMVAIIGVYVWSGRTVSRWAAARYGISETVAGHAYAFLVFLVSSFVWIYFDVATLLESHGLSVRR